MVAERYKIYIWSDFLFGWKTGYNQVTRIRISVWILDEEFPRSNFSLCGNFNIELEKKYPLISTSSFQYRFGEESLIQISTARLKQTLLETVASSMNGETKKLLASQEKFSLTF